MRNREPRRNVYLKARMRQGSDWSDVTIRNVSARGMLLWAEEPPRPGTYLEICGPATTLVVRTMWSRDGYFGVRSQDRIDVESALRGSRWRCVDPTPGMPRRGANDVAIHHEGSRHRGASYEFGALLLGALAIAILSAMFIHSFLAAPFAEISSKLGGG